MISLLRDAAQATRRLLREKGFTTTVLATLALCLAANVVIFTVVHAVLLKPLPFRNPDRLVVLYNSYPNAGVARAGASIPNYYDRRGQLPGLEEIAILNPGTAIVGEAGAPHREHLTQATPSIFKVLRIQPQLGRFFTEEENVYGNSDVVVITDAYWRSHFNADPGVLDTTIRMNDVPTKIIGVLPKHFHYLSERSPLWIPRPSNERDRQPDRRHSNNHEMIGSMKPGVTIQEVQAQMDALNTRLAESDPFRSDVKDAGFTTRVADLRAEHVSRVRPMLLLLQSGVLFLLVIGLVNLVNLLLIRASARSKELAVRQVLGAARSSIASLVIAETGVLAFAGGLLGLGLGALALHALAWLGADQLPMSASIDLDPAVALTALGVAIVVGLLLALPVMGYNLHGSLAPVLNSESRSGTTTRAHHRLRHTLIVAQVALAFVLLAGAGLLGVSFRHVLQAQPGFQPDNLLTAHVSLPWVNYRENEDRMKFAERLLTELRAIPGVKSAAISTALPFANASGRNAIWIEGHTPAPGESVQTHYTYTIKGDYFDAVGIPLFAGRPLNEADSRGEGRVCVIDETVARRYWPDGNALGHRLFSGPPNEDHSDAITIVGVVGSTVQNELGESDNPGMIYFPFRLDAWCPGDGYISLRTQQSPETAAPSLRKAILSIDPGLPVDDLQTMTARLDNSLTSRRSPMIMAATFASVALLLAGIGIYGVLAYAVSQRQREIGVRMALGAQPDRILKQFLFLGGRLLAIGTVLGLAGAWLLGRTMSSMLFGVVPTNPGVFFGTILVIATAGLLASFLPARRASRVHPMEAMRSD